MLDGVGRLFKRHTLAREQVVKAVSAMERPFSGEVVNETLPQVGRATIYRTLSLLEQEGFLCRVELETDAINYHVSLGDHHHHLVCVDCRSVRDVAACEVAEFVRRAVPPGAFEPLAHHIEIYGRCHQCLEGAHTDCKNQTEKGKVT